MVTTTPKEPTIEAPEPPHYEPDMPMAFGSELRLNLIPAKAGIQIGLTRLNLSLRAQRGNLVARARNFIDSNTGASKKFPFASLRLRAFALNFLAITQLRNSYPECYCRGGLRNGHDHAERADHRGSRATPLRT